MSVYCQDRVQEISERVRRCEYQIDPVAVADAIVHRAIWDDVPDVVSLPAADLPEEPQTARLRALVRVRRLVSAPILPRTPLRA